jgi:ketosteroid isomerase-like protein
MKCPKCGAEVKEGLAACSVCFAPLTGEEAERVAKLAKEAPQPRPPARRTAEAMPSSSAGKGGGAVAAILVIILLAAAGVASWYYFIYLRSPQYAARQFLDGLKNKNYQQIYDYGLWTGVLGQFIRSADDVRKAFDMAAQMGADQTFDAYTIKKVTVNGDRATVSVAVTRAGKTGDTDFIFVKTNDGKWKCDLIVTLQSEMERLMRNMRISPFRLGR